VRPGGLEFTSPLPFELPVDEPEPLDSLQFKAAPLLEAVPLGAPVRINYEPANTSDQPIAVPHSPSLASGFVKGYVIGPSGSTRRFRSLFIVEFAEVLTVLEPGQRMLHSMTLLRGRDGAFFAEPGLYQVVLEMLWHIDGVGVGLKSQTNVIVTTAISEDHAKAALKVLSTPDVHLVLVLYEFGLTLVHRAATLQSLHRGPHLEAHPCATPCPH
jgi:hypothetical protein